MLKPNSFLVGALVGFGAGVIAAGYSKEGANFRGAAKSVIKSFLLAGDNLKTGIGVLSENIQDIAAEAKSELEQAAPTGKPVPEVVSRATVAH